MNKHILLDVISAIKEKEMVVLLTNPHISFIALFMACFWFYLFCHSPQLESPKFFDFQISLRFQNEIIPRYLDGCLTAGHVDSEDKSCLYTFQGNVNISLYYMLEILCMGFI